MDLAVVYDVQHGMAFGPLVALYFFLAGLSAGLFLISSFSTVFDWEEMRPLAKVASVLALAAIIPGGLSLLLDLGQPLRALYLFIAFNPTSIMSWGSYILLIYSLVTAVYAWLVWNGDRRAKTWGWTGVITAVALGLYTGVLISVAPGHPLWNSAVIPVLFLVSGIVAALSLLNVLQALSGGKVVQEGARESLHSLKVMFVTMELILIAAHVLILGMLGSSGLETARHLLFGARQFSFIGVQIIAGTLLPLVIILFAHRSNAALGIAGLLSLIGIMALRYNVVIAGQELPVQGAFMNTLEDGNIVWFYTALLLAMAVALCYILPRVFERYCRASAAPASNTVGV